MPVPGHGYLLPDVQDAERMCFRVSVPNNQQHIAAFMGQLAELGFWYTWQRDPDHFAREVSTTWRAIFEQVSTALNRGDFLSGDCTEVDCDALIDCLSGRIRTSANGLQYKNNAGDWIDLPSSQGDPRTDGTVPPGWTSPPAGQSGPCLTGANIAAIFKSNNDKLIAELQGAAEILTGIEIVSALMGILFPPFEILAVAASAFAALAFEIGAVALDAALTSDQYDLVKCIVECHTAADGTIGLSEALQMQYDGETQLNSIASQLFSKFIDTFGPNGLMLMERIAGIVEADCSSCAACPWTSIFDFRVQSYENLFFIVTPQTHWELNIGWVGDPAYGVQIQPQWQSAIELLEVTWDYYHDGNSGTNVSGTYTNTGYYGPNVGISVAGPGQFSHHEARTVAFFELSLLSANYCSGCNEIITHLYVRGNGDKPDGWP